jgi:16S rRNA (adenine1518-N6/adenine1519-N6)-dimethyltransferase
VSHAPRKRFGQHFLVDPTVIAAIVRVIDPQPEDHMVEIGPGLSALTAPLMQVVKPLHVVEIDRDIIARLQRAHGPDALVVHAGDALEFDFSKLAENGWKRPSNGHLQGIALGEIGASPVRPLRLVGNLPYNISTPLLFHFAAHAAWVADMTFMLQKEVVDRMVAAPGSKAFGRLSVMLQVQFDMAPLLDVPPEAFDPPPKVQSAVVLMRPKALPAGLDLVRMGELVTAAFGQRRKTLRNALAAQASAAQLEALNINPGARAEELPVADYVRLAQAMPTLTAPAATAG